MNYRHHFHAGNFADVMKHALLTRLVRALQRKEKPYLFLDTHAGRGLYDLAAAATGDSLARQPEWPNGIGRLCTQPRADLPEPLADYVDLVRSFDRRAGNLAEGLRFYPGSPWLVRLVARPLDRLALCELHPGECGKLQAELAAEPNVSVHQIDGYVGLRAMLPPRERRGLVLLDPPYEAQDEFALLSHGLDGGLQRFATGVFVVWYPLTLRARADDFLSAVQALNPPPALALELMIAGEDSPLKMKGCGLLVINPPWGFEAEARLILEFLVGALAQEPGGGARLEWIVRAR